MRPIDADVFSRVITDALCFVQETNGKNEILELAVNLALDLIDEAPTLSVQDLKDFIREGGSNHVE